MQRHKRRRNCRGNVFEPVPYFVVLIQSCIESVTLESIIAKLSYDDDIVRPLLIRVYENCTRLRAGWYICYL